MDKDELEQEISKIHNLLYSRAYSKLKNKENVEDVVAETLFLILKYYTQLRDKGKFKAWAFKILDHECAKFYKKSEDDKKLIDKVKDYVEESDFSAVENVENNRDFEELIKVLDEDEKRIFRLYCREHKTFDKISKMLDTNPNTVRSIYRRGKEKLKEVVEKDNVKKFMIIFFTILIFSSGISIAILVKNSYKESKNYEFYYKNEEIDEIEYNIENNKLKVKIDFNENKINRDNFEIYPETNPIYLVNVSKTENIIYAKDFEWIEKDIFEIEFECNEENLGSNASIHIVLAKGESITILLKN